MTKMLVNNLNGGVMSPRMRFRTDFQKRLTALKLGENLVVDSQGGITKRPGTELINKTAVPKVLPITDERAEYVSQKTEPLYSIPWTAVAGTGNSMMVYSCEDTIGVFDVVEQKYIDINWADTTYWTPTELGFGRIPPVITDHVTLNDVIIFTTADDEIHKLTREYVAGVPVITLNQWDYTKPNQEVDSDSYSNQIIRPPMALRQDLSDRWPTGSIAATYAGYSKASVVLPYNYDTQVSNTTVGSQLAVVLTDQKYSTVWSGAVGTADRRLILVPDNIGTGTTSPRQGNTVYRARHTEDNLNTPNEYTPYELDNLVGIGVIPDQGYIVIPDEADILNTASVDTVPRDRYVALITTTKVIKEGSLSVSTMAGNAEDLVGGTFLTEAMIEEAMNSGEPQYESHFAGVLPSAGDDTGTFFFQFDGTEQDTTKLSLSNTDVAGYTEYPTGDGRVDDNNSYGWTYSTKGIDVRDTEVSTNITDSWDPSTIVSETVALGYVLGDWTFRTAGNWTGTMVIQSNNGGGWTDVQLVSSDKDYNIVINDGEESSYGVQYRLVIDLTASSGTQAVPAGYTFTWDNFNSVYKTGGVAFGAFLTSNWYATPVVYDFDSIIFHQQRLWITSGSQLYYSATNDLNNFASYGIPSDSSAGSLSLADTQSAQINWTYVVGQDIMLGTTRAQWGIRGEGGVLTARTAYAVKQTSFPTTNVKPVSIGNKYIFADVSGKRILASVYDYTTESYSTEELSIFSADLFKHGIVKLVYHPTDKILYCLVNLEDVPNNGYVQRRGIVAVNYDPTQNIIASSEFKIANLTFDYDTGVRDIEMLDEDIYIIRSSQDHSLQVDMLRFTDSDTNVGDYYVSSFGKSRTNSQLVDHHGLRPFWRAGVEQDWRSTELPWNDVPVAYDGLPSVDYLLRDERAEFPNTDGNSVSIEYMYPIVLEGLTFPIDWGTMGPDHTYDRVKSITEIIVCADSIALGTATLDEWETEEHFGDAVYDGTYSEYVPAPVDGQFQIPIVGAWSEDSLMIGFRDSGPYRANINALIYNITMGK